MVKSCSVFLCKQRGNYDQEGNKVTYHKVPTDPARRKLWLQSIRRRDFLYQKSMHIYVCSKHFDKSDFQYQQASGHAYLPKDINPTRFVWDFSKPSETSSACEKNDSCNNTSGNDEKKASTLAAVEPSVQCHVRELSSTDTSSGNHSDIRSTCMDFVKIKEEVITSTLEDSYTEVDQMREEIAMLVNALKSKSHENDGNRWSLKVAKEEIRLLKEKVLQKDDVIKNLQENVNNLQQQVQTLSEIGITPGMIIYGD